MSSVIRKVFDTYTHKEGESEMGEGKQDNRTGKRNERESYKFIICLFTYEGLVTGIGGLSSGAASMSARLARHP